VASSGLTCILNCASGSCSGPELREQLSRTFAEIGTPARILLAPSGAQVSELARRAVQENSRIIVAGGGDGTLNAVATEIMGTSIPLGVLPLGTWNHFTKDLRIPQEDCGIDGLTDRSRRPFRYANQLPFQVENYILNVKRDRLLRRFSGIPIPAKSTVHAVLDRHRLVERRGRVRRRAQGTPLSLGSRSQRVVVHRLQR
jgi:Diacylglycerol kinase catalytic domain